MLTDWLQKQKCLVNTMRYQKSTNAKKSQNTQIGLLKIMFQSDLFEILIPLSYFDTFLKRTFTFDSKVLY